MLLDAYTTFSNSATANSTFYSVNIFALEDYNNENQSENN